MRTVDHLTGAARATKALLRSGVLRPERPDRLWHLAQAVRHWGPGLAAVFAMGAARYGNGPALVDERGWMSFADLDARSDAIARGLVETGVHAGDTVAVLCRNHRYFFEITGALAKLGANALYLNTGFAAPQIAAVMQRERERSSCTTRSSNPFVTDRREPDARLDRPTRPTPRTTPRAEHVGRARSPVRERSPPRPSRPAGRTIILTVGHHRTAQRRVRRRHAHPGAAIALLERLPYRAHEKMVIARRASTRGDSQTRPRACCSATRWCSSASSIRNSRSR